MKIQRNTIWKIVFLLFGDNRTGLAIDAESLTVLQRRPKRIPFLEIAGISHMRTRYFLAAVCLPLRNGKTLEFKGAKVAQAKKFIVALNRSWRDAWRLEIEKHYGPLRSLARAIDRLETPRRFPAACLVEPYWQQTKTLLRSWPRNIPDALLSPEMTENYRKLFDFHDAPGKFRDDAVNHFIEKELAEMSRFLDGVEKNPLTIEQRLAVISDEDATLVLAGAGSGKTSVIAAKAAYLVKKGICQPEQILLLAFAKDAANEMSERIKQVCGTSVKALTFHALANSIIGEVEGSKPPVAPHAPDEKRFWTHLREILLDQVETNERMRFLLLNWFAQFFIPPKSLWDFETKHDYYEYIENCELRTFQGEKVRSFEELEIANWLYMNGIAYEYEPVYEHPLHGTSRKAYTPDFRLKGSGVYIEHFGVRREWDNHGNEYLTTAPYIDRNEYLESMKWKREVHAEHGTTLIETFSYEKSAGRLISALEEKLAPYEKVNPQPAKQVLDQLRDRGEIDSFSKTLGTFLQHFKGSGLTLKECHSKASGFGKQDRELAFLEIFETVFREYQKRLGKHIDFDDMISRATDHVRTNRFRSPYRHLLVDEFQDISKGRATLLIALKEQHGDARIFAVGDDWQSIYRFSGSDIHLMNSFGRIFGGDFAGQTSIHRAVDLGRTFRSVDRIAYPARSFVLKNPSQIEKKVIPAGMTFATAIQVFWHNSQYGEAALEEALANLPDQAGGASTDVLLVARYKWREPDRNALSQLKKRYPGLSISFKTIHASKGLESDHVIILGAESGRFGLPSEVVDDPVLNLVLPEPESFKHAEERRVFYVALTRARKSVTIIARENRPSSFVLELLEGEEFGVTEMGNARHCRFRCPGCGGHMVLNRNSRYVCEHDFLCHTRLPPCPSCGTGLPLRNAHRPDISQCACGATFPACPKCGDGWLVERKGKFGRFRGCVNYPPCDGKKSA